MDGNIIYNETNISVYDNEISNHHHYNHPVTHQQQTHMVTPEMINQHHEPLPITSTAPNNYEGSCWHFMPPDYPYCSEDDFR